MEYNRLVTGEKCTLFSLFSKDNVVIIPDLQRDYCWGNNVWNEQGDTLQEVGDLREVENIGYGNEHHDDDKPLGQPSNQVGEIKVDTRVT